MKPGTIIKHGNSLGIFLEKEKDYWRKIFVIEKDRWSKKYTIRHKTVSVTGLNPISDQRRARKVIFKKIFMAG